MNRKTSYDIDDDLIDSDINALQSPQSRRYKKLENSENIVIINTYIFNPESSINNGQ